MVVLEEGVVSEEVSLVSFLFPSLSPSSFEFSSSLRFSRESEKLRERSHCHRY
jgi:hypothetical protein